MYKTFSQELLRMQFHEEKTKKEIADKFILQS